MYLRRCYRQKDGKRHAYWALVESLRTARGPRQRVVAYLGEMDEAGRLGVRQQAEYGNGTWQSRLFDRAEPEWVEVDLKRIAVERSREFGGPWLGLELCRRLGLVEFLERAMASGREEIPWPLMALVLVLGRLCEPSSELHLAEHFYEASALAELLGVPAEKVNEDRLYRTLDRLLPHKEALEKHLKERLGELFELDYDLLLYDVTSTYFEGEAAANPLAQRGYSRGGALWARPDCKQVNLALVVSRGGMPLGYELFAGNRPDVTTLEEMVAVMEARYGKANRIWALDRGMISEDNIEFLKREGRRYIAGTPQGRLKRFERELLAADWRQVHGGLEVRRCAAPDGSARFQWQKVERWRDWARLSEGCYLLRSNVTDWSAEDLRRAYIQLTEAEAAFRIHQSDLDLRPVWHQKQERVEAHILVCFPAYVLWKTLAHTCRTAGLGDEPRKVFEELSQVALVEVALPTRTGVTIRKRYVSRPTEHQAILLQRLGLRLPPALDFAPV
jgi:hypothetical protein